MKKILAFVFAAVIAADIALCIPPSLPKPEPLNFKPPQGTRYEMPNGMVIYLLADRTLPVIHARAYIRTGSQYDPADKTGLGNLLGTSMRAGGSLKYKADDMNRILEMAGASINSGMGPESGSISMTCLSKDLDTVFDIFADIAANPAFEPDKVKIEKEKMLDSIKRRNDSPSQIVFREGPRMLFGPEHPYGRIPQTGTVESITPEDLKASHGRYYKPNAIILAIGGDFDENAMCAKISEKFNSWQKGELNLPQITAPEIKKERAVYVMNKPFSQSWIFLGEEGYKRKDYSDSYNMIAANEVLGGSGLASRLGSEVRSRRGLAYSVFSGIRPRDLSGMLYAAVGTKPASAAQAIEQILLQIEKIKKEVVPADEFQRSKDGIINPFVFRFQTAFDVVDERASYEYFGYPADYLDTYVDNIAKVSAGDVLKSAQKWYHPENMIIYAVGDPGQFDKPFSVFGPVTETKPE